MIQADVVADFLYAMITITLRYMCPALCFDYHSILQYFMYLINFLFAMNLINLIHFPNNCFLCIHYFCCNACVPHIA